MKYLICLEVSSLCHFVMRGWNASASGEALLDHKLGDPGEAQSSFLGIWPIKQQRAHLQKSPSLGLTFFCGYLKILKNFIFEFVFIIAFWWNECMSKGEMCNMHVRHPFFVDLLTAIGLMIPSEHIILDPTMCGSTARSK